MFLKNLIIQNGSEVVREITFHKGLNLIIDETPPDQVQESGNSVGKTTVIRLIDFCLGGSGNNIYKDSEFKDKSNTQIEKFLKENPIIITLTLTEDLANPQATEIEIKKNFKSYSGKIQQINGEQIKNNNDFQAKLNKLIFKTSTERPTFREIIAKNIRDEKTRLFNTLRVLHVTTKVEQYEALFLFWLGIDTDTAHRKQILIDSRNSEERVLNKIKKDTSFSEIEQALEVIKRDIEEKSKIKESFNINQDHSKDFTRINDARNQINKLSNKISRLVVRRNLILECLNDLKKEHVNIDLNALKNLYENAKKFIPEMNKRLDDLVSFHNKMLTEKIAFISKELPEIDTNLKEAEAEMEILNREIKLLSLGLDNNQSNIDYDKLIIELNQLYEQKGRYEERFELWTSITNKLKEINDELEQLNKGILDKETLLTNRITEFNKFFSKLSEELYDEKFILSVDKTERAFELKISNIGGNLGTGKKKGQIAAFDFAYIQYADEQGIPCLHFILHDQIENVHDNQLQTLEKIANRNNCQFVLPVLRDKLPINFSIDKYAVIKLSQREKLFKIP